MRNLDLDWDDQYDYGPNEMVELSINNPREYNKIMSQNVGDSQAIREYHETNMKFAAECLA